VACYINVTTGLRHNQEALQKLLWLAGKGLPAIYVPVSLGGMTAPITTAGAIAMDHAGILVGLVLSQLKREGAPLIVPAYGGQALDMLTLVDPYCQPDQRGGLGALAHFHQLPMFSLGGCSDAKAVDQQAALEAALTLMVDIQSGGHLIHDLGYLESGLTGSLAQLAMCDEIVHWIRRATAEVEVSDETLALDVIDAVGPDGEFLTAEHTLKHVRDPWYPRLLDRHVHDDWLSEGGLTLRDRAAARVDEILASHQPQPLPEAASRTLRDIVARAARA
jgi:trimethylamine--corrinoid protein Co-methyltransferase